MKTLVKNRLRSLVASINGRRYSRQLKVFCVGRNKTGTTSLAKLFQQLEIPVGEQRTAERLFADWAAGDYKRLIEYVRFGGIAFQDVPFSLPNTYRVMDEAFPGSKFILTVRDSPEVWYDSLVRFQTKLFGKDGQLPTRADLEAATYIEPGWVWRVFSTLQATPDDDLYNKATFIRSYEDHNREVRAYFADRPGQLLTVNVKDDDAAARIATFLGYDDVPVAMPWENKT